MKKILLSFLFVAFASLIGQRAYAEVLIVANSSIKASVVSKSELSEVFTGSSSSLKDGSHAIPVLLKQGPVHDAFLSQFIGKSDSTFRAGWRSLVFSGQGAMPKTFDSESALIDYVASTPGAIGYISKSTAHDKVKTLAVK